MSAVAKRAVVTSCMLVAGVVVMARAAMAQAPPSDSTTVAKPDSTAAAPVTPPPAASPAPAVTATAHTTPPPAAAPAQGAGMFSKGNKRLTGTVGWGHSFGNDYLLVGVGAGYYLANGLDVGLDFEGWFIGDPQVYKLSPRADYVLWKMKRIKPYAGAFYRWNFIGSGIDDKSSLGGRAGAFYQSRGGRSMAGAGVVYERYLNLDERLGSSDVLYPEFFVAVSF
jgi:hypothetical protein